MTDTELMTLVTAIIGAVCGILGSVLGVINTLDQLNRNRVRLRVTPKLAFMVGGGGVVTVSSTESIQDLLSRIPVPIRLCVEVVNLSTFPITICEVGVGKPGKLRCVLLQPDTPPGKTWPTRLDSREAVVLYGMAGELIDPRVVTVPVAFAKTDCGRIRYGRSPAFTEFLRLLSRRRESR